MNDIKQRNPWSENIFCTIIGLITNILLVVLKLVIGFVGRSQALIADGIHSLSDGVGTGVSYFALKYAEKKPDKEHPYGHGNVEIVASSLISIILIITGIFLGYKSVGTFVRKEFVEPSTLALIAAIISIFIKEGLFRYTIWVANKNNSPAVKAAAYDHRSDAYSSVAAAIGIGGAKLGYLFLDPVAGVIIAIMIFKMGIDIIKDSYKILMFSQPDEAVVDEVKEIVENISDVKGISKLKFHQIGSYFSLDISILVDKEIKVIEGHNIATNVKSILMEKKSIIKDVNVHVDPYV